MASTTISVVTELLDHDHWCRRCLRSSGIRAWVAVRVGTGRLSMQVRTWCQDCGSREISIDSEPRHC